MPDISVTRDIAAPPEAIFELVSDPTRMGEWSPENTGATWSGDATCATVGAKFVGRNRNGTKSWTTTGRVTRLDAPTSFAFDVSAGPFKVSAWSFEITPTGTGSTVTESTTDHRNWLITKLGNRVSGVTDRAETNRQGITATLDALAAHLET